MYKQETHTINNSLLYKKTNYFQTIDKKLVIPRNKSIPLLQTASSWLVRKQYQHVNLVIIGLRPYNELYFPGCIIMQYLRYNYTCPSIRFYLELNLGYTYGRGKGKGGRFSFKTKTQVQQIKGMSVIHMCIKYIIIYDCD